MPSELFKRQILHKPKMNLEKFHEDHIPKSSLPREYGGDLECIADLYDQQRKSLMDMRNFFLSFDRLLNFEFEDYDLSVLNE